VEMTSLVTKLFGPPEEIAAFPTHLHRWKIFGNKRLKVYLEHSCGTDWSGDIGTYPQRFLAVGFAESTMDESAAQLELFSDRAAWTVLIGSSSGRRENRAAH
jgi:hypothetical protein